MLYSYTWKFRTYNGTEWRRSKLMQIYKFSSKVQWPTMRKQNCMHLTILYHKTLPYKVTNVKNIHVIKNHKIQNWSISFFLKSIFWFHYFMPSDITNILLTWNLQKILYDPESLWFYITYCMDVTLFLRC